VGTGSLRALAAQLGAPRADTRASGLRVCGAKTALNDAAACA
jgi:hypothetical protein